MIRRIKNSVRRITGETAAPVTEPLYITDSGEANVLYISYMGLLQPLGQSQVYRYLRKLAADHDIALITYERPDDLANMEQLEHLQEEVTSAGIEWYPLKYHNDPSLAGTIWDLLVGLWLCRRVIDEKKIETVHTRSYVPSILGLTCKHLFGTGFVFDMRGFLPDERVDAGQWETDDAVYRAGKWFETKFLQNADVVVSLTRAGINAIEAFDHIDTTNVRFELIPTCVDLELFTPQPENREQEFVLGYVGSAGTWYLFEDVLECFGLICERRPNSKLLILNQGDHEYIQKQVSESGVDEDAVRVKAVDHSAVPTEINRMDAGIFFYTPTFSKKATSPTKMGEFLACGLPCLSNAEVGDVEKILEGEGVGVTLSSFATDAKEVAVERLLSLSEDPATAARCRQVAESYYSLDTGVEKYDTIYKSLRNNE